MYMEILKEKNCFCTMILEVGDEVLEIRDCTMY